MTRRLVGWRVRWEWHPYTDGQWREDWTHLMALPTAHERAGDMRHNDRCRNVRVMRVWRVKR